MKAIYPLGILVLSCLASSFSHAQFGPDAARERARDRAIEATANAGAEFESNQTVSESIVSTMDLAYGVHARQKLDLYLPEISTAGSTTLPVVIFIHGGGFTRGDKSSGANIAGYFADKGIAAISANYRFPPEHTWPSGAEDVGDMIQWVHRNASDYGIDAERIFLMGHSAGAGHVASYVFFEEFQVFEDGVAGALLVSGPTYELDLVLNEEGIALAFDGEAAYFGRDLSQYASMSSIKNIAGRKIPLLIAYAENDTPNIQIENAALIQAVFERDKILPTVIQGIGHDHMSIGQHLEAGQDSIVGAQMISFIEVH